MSVPYLKDYYKNKVLPEIQKSRGHKNVHQVPSVVKVVINTGIDASTDKNTFQDILRDLAQISGQKPLTTVARKSISNFKLREGMPVGAKVTLRGARMYDFLYRLIAVALPTIRDFRGVPNKLDGKGNYTLGIADHTIFPEITLDGTRRGTLGMDITIVTSAETDEEGHELLSLLGMPFRKN